MHKARLKKLETKQRAQEELRKRDAEIQRVREPEARTPFNNYRKHIAGLLYRNIVSIVSSILFFGFFDNWLKLKFQTCRFLAIQNTFILAGVTQENTVSTGFVY